MRKGGGGHPGASEGLNGQNFHPAALKCKEPVMFYTGFLFGKIGPKVSQETQTKHQKRLVYKVWLWLSFPATLVSPDGPGRAETAPEPGPSRAGGAEGWGKPPPV